MYGLDQPSSSPTHDEKLPITDPSTIVNALVHCIDRASGRDAVHDPDTEHDLDTRRKAFMAMLETQVGGLSEKEQADFEWTTQVLAKKKKTWRGLVVYKPGKVLGVEGWVRPKWLSGSG
jgi:hypothetical protein